MADIRIPNAALEAGVKAFAAAEANDYTTHAEDLAAAFRAIIEAWEGAKTIRDDGRRQTYAIPALILPLPTEASDE